MAVRSSALTAPLRGRHLGAGGFGPRRIVTLLAVMAVMAAAGYGLFTHF